MGRQFWWLVFGGDLLRQEPPSVPSFKRRLVQALTYRSNGFFVHHPIRIPSFAGPLVSGFVL